MPDSSWTDKDWENFPEAVDDWQLAGKWSPYGHYSSDPVHRIDQGGTQGAWRANLLMHPMSSSPESNAIDPLPPPMAKKNPESDEESEARPIVPKTLDRGWKNPASVPADNWVPNTTLPDEIRNVDKPWLKPEATNVSATQGAQVNQSQSAQNAENAKVSKSHDLNWNAFPFAFPTFADNQSAVAPSTDLSDLNEGLAASAMTRGGIPFPQMAVATGIRGIGRDYVQAIDDLNKGKVTEADREARIAESSKEANEYWGGIRQKVVNALSEGGGGVLGQLGQTQGVSALGMAGPLGESADLVRPPSLQNRVANPQQQPVQTPQFNKNIPPPFQGENLPSDTAQPAPTYARNKPAWKHFPLVG